MKLCFSCRTASPRQTNSPRNRHLALKWAAVLTPFSFVASSTPGEYAAAMAGMSVPKLRVDLAQTAELEELCRAQTYEEL